MTRETAIMAMDALVGEGYSVVLTASNIEPHIISDGEGATTSVFYWVDVSDMNLNSVDLLTLCDLAGGLGLKCVFSHVRGRAVSLRDVRVVHEAIAGPPRHPKSARASKR